jgi:peptidoglycan/xylan/chitin deacetylase (PgdA/CDA1 family)
MRLCRPVVQVSATLAVLVLGGGAVARAQTPLAVSGASLTQQGQDLGLSVSLNRPFYPQSLQREHVSLCLLVEWPSGAVRRTVCLAPGPHGGPPPRLIMGKHAIAATVTISRHTRLRASFLPSAVGMGYTRLRWQVQFGTSLFPTRGPLLRMHTPRLVGCVPSGAPFVSSGPTTGRLIALTFDDGPWYDTPQFLDVLEREHVVATFFQIGEQIAQYGSVDRRMLRDGDMIGDHTWNHANVSGGGSFAAGEISQAAAAIRGATGGFSPCLFRAPGGDVSPGLISEARSMGFTTIQWNIDPRDWALPGTGAIYGNVIANARPGAIVIQHDGGGNRSETLAALPQEIDSLRREGYHFVTVTQLLGYRLLYK